MEIIVKARPNSKHYEVKKISEHEYVVSVKEPPIRGRANEAIVKTLANHFKTSSSKVRIVSGHASRNKIVEIKN